MQATAQQPRLDEVEREIVEGSNALRQAHGQPPASPDPALTAAAREFAAYMARTDRYGHDADGSDPPERAKAQAYEACMVSENIAWQVSSTGFGTTALARGFFEGWFESPGHRRNLLAPLATETGVGVAHSAGSGRYYAVQMFGRPARLQVHFALSNHSASALRYTVDDEAFTLARGETGRHQRCQPPTLRLEAAGGAEPTTWQPADGAHYRIEVQGQQPQRLSR